MGLITFGANGVSTFQNAKSSVIVQLINNNAPFMVNVNCKAHQISLAVQTLPNFKVVRHVEDFLVALYSYFNSFPKRTLEFQKLALCSAFKGNKVRKIVKTHRLSFAWVAKRVLKKYKPLVTKMAVDISLESTTKTPFYACRLVWYVNSTLPNGHARLYEILH